MGGFKRDLRKMVTLQSMQLMTWLFTVTPFAMTLLFAAVLLNEGFERTVALYRRAYLPKDAWRR